MIHRPKDESEGRSLLLSRILDPEYIGSAPTGVLGARSSLPQASVFVDRWGQAHDPDFRPFGSHPVVTPAVEEPQWPWYDDDDGPSTARLSNSTVSSSFQSRSSISSGSRSRSASMLQTPPLEPDSPNDGRHISPPGHIPRASLFPWTPAQRAARVQHEVTKRNIPPPPPLLEEEREDIPLTLVDSRYVPGYGHFAAPPSQTRAQTAPEAETPKHKGRARSHTVPASSDVAPESPGCSTSFRQSVYSFGLKTKLGLHHFKTRMRRASGAARRPHSL